MTATLKTLESLLRAEHGISLDDFVSGFETRPDEAFFWSGSWVEGLANSRSDLDFYLIGSPDGRPGEAEMTGPGLPPMYMSLTGGKVHLDVTIVPPELLDAVGAMLRKFDPDSAYPTALSDNLRELLHRIRIGIAVSGHSTLQRYQKIIDHNAFKRYLLAYYHNRADSLLIDVTGLMEEGDHYSAYFIARQRLDVVIDMFLVAKGQTNTRVDKWRWKKLNRIEGLDSRMAADYLASHGLDRDGSDAEVATRVRRCLTLADRVLLATV
jgi:hypothetical protein